MKSLQPSFGQFRKIQASNVLRQKEIPIEHYISLPLPVIAHGKNGYGYFACPTRRIVGEPGSPVQVEYGGVDRTWILSADGGALLKYDLVDAPATATLTDPTTVGSADQLLGPQPVVVTATPTSSDLVVDRLS